MNVIRIRSKRKREKERNIAKIYWYELVMKMMNPKTAV